MSEWMKGYLLGLAVGWIGATLGAIIWRGTT